MPETEENGPNEPQETPKELRQAAEAGRKALAEAEAARRELAFVKAGVDTDSKLGQLLLKTYEGELTMEAIVAEATELGAIKVPASTEPEINETERSQSRERQALSSEAQPAGSTDEHPKVRARVAFEDAVKNGDPRDVAAGAALAEILKAAHAGDPRVFVE